MRAVKRLRAIASLIENSNVVADIGADHGYLAKILLDEKRARKIIATDISEKSLSKTKKLSADFGLENISLRVGDGLEPIESEEADVVVIAGMGGYEIIKILEKAKQKHFDRFIFQPAQNTVNLREYLIENNFEIIKDFIVKDQAKFYNTLEVRKSKSRHELNAREVRYGLTNFDLRSRDFADYLTERMERVKEILKENKSSKLEEEQKELLEIWNELYKGENHARNN